MKKILLFLFLFITLNSEIYCQTKSIVDLIGRWEGSDSESKMGSLIFIDDRNLILTIKNHGTKSATFQIDYNKDPMWFDLNITNGNKTTVLKGLLHFNNKNELKWQLTYSAERKDGFLKETVDNTLVLKRQ